MGKVKINYECLGDVRQDTCTEALDKIIACAESDDCSNDDLRDLVINLAKVMREYTGNSF